MKSSAVKRSLVIDGRKTSVSLEEPFWRDLKEIADSQGVTLSNIVQDAPGAEEPVLRDPAVRTRTDQKSQKRFNARLKI